RNISSSFEQVKRRFQWLVASDVVGKHSKALGRWSSLSVEPEVTTLEAIETPVHEHARFRLFPDLRAPPSLVLGSFDECERRNRQDRTNSAINDFGIALRPRTGD